MRDSSGAIAALSSIPFGAVTTVRNWLYDKGILRTYRVNLPVISVGNISAGGNGKTPLSIFLARELSQRGHSPVLLSRGYGGSLRGPIVLTPQHTTLETGDEPALISIKTKCPVVISRDRVAGAEFVQRERLGSVIILDDAFQHRRLRRDVDIVCIDVSTEQAVRDFVRGLLLPLGRFRENRARALKRAQVVVLMRRSLSKAAPVSTQDLRILLPSHVQVFQGELASGVVREILSGTELLPQDIAAFCGIANPAGFFESLRTLGYRLCGQRHFRDHHPFSESDIAGLVRDFPGLPLVCTEKDAVKIRRLAASQIGNASMYALEVGLQINPADEMMSAIIGRIGGRR